MYAIRSYYEKYKNDYSKFASDVFKKSIFVDKAKYEAFLSNPKLKTLENDLVYQIALSTRETYNNSVNELSKTGDIDKRYNRLFIEGLMEMYPNKVFYPDANFTMRLSYGKVGNYEPKDAVIYKHYTTLAGIMEKEDPVITSYSIHYTKLYDSPLALITGLPELPPVISLSDVKQTLKVPSSAAYWP